MSKSHTKKTAWADQQDKKLVSSLDDEVETVQARMKKEGITISAQQIRFLITEYGPSRRRLYAIIRESQQPQPENTESNDANL